MNRVINEEALSRRAVENVAEERRILYLHNGRVTSLLTIAITLNVLCFVVLKSMCYSLSPSC